MQNRTDVRPFNALTVTLMAGTAACGAEWCSDALADISSAGGSVLAILINILPYVIAAITAAVAGNAVNRKIRLRTLLLIGIALHCVGGFLPAVLSGIPAAVLICRIVFGVGYGITLALSFALVFRLYSEETKRNAALGFGAAAQFAVVLLGAALVGVISGSNTSNTFFICLWDVIPFIAVITLCPDFEIYTAPKAEGSGLSKLEQLASNDAVDYSAKALPSVVWVFTAAAALFTLGLTLAFSTLDSLADTRCGGQGADLAVIVFLAAGVLGAVLYGTKEKILKAASLTVFFLASAAACIALLFVNSAVLLCIAFGVFGFFCAGIMPAMFNRIFALVDENGIFLAGGFIACGSAVGIAVKNLLSAVLHGYVPSVMIAAVIFAVCGLLTSSYSKKAY